MTGEGAAKDYPEMGGRSPASVFISHASQDTTIAKAVVEDLERHGVRCWIAPRDLKAGSQSTAEIVAAINHATLVIMVLSEHAIASPHVGREVERAASKRRGIIVLRTDAVPLTRSFEYFLSESQWVDVAALGVPAALAKITQSVRERIAVSSWVSPGLGADARNPADRRRRPSYRTIKRVVLTAFLLLIAAVIGSVVIRYWPTRQAVPHTMIGVSERSPTTDPGARY